MTQWVVVPAAGLGERFGQSELSKSSHSSSLPKQYQLLNGRAIIEHTLERLLSIEPTRIVVAVHPQDAHWRALAITDDPRVLFVEGGCERSDSVLRALLTLEHLAEPDDCVLVHDVARPCVRPEDVRRLIALTGEHPGGGLLAATLTDTVKRVGRDGVTIKTENRDELWAAMTPQLCRYGLLVSALKHVRDKGIAITDEASALEAIGHQPKVVPGRRDNIKITYREDIALAEAILLSQQKECWEDTNEPERELI